MICPKCGEDGVFFQDVRGYDNETIELGFICKRCKAEFMVELDSFDLKEV